MSMREAYKKRMEARILEWEAEIEELKAKAEDASGGIKEQYKGIIEDLTVKKDQAALKITEFKNYTGDAVDEVKKGFDSALGVLKESFEKAKAKF